MLNKTEPNTRGSVDVRQMCEPVASVGLAAVHSIDHGRLPHGYHCAVLVRRSFREEGGPTQACQEVRAYGERSRLSETGDPDFVDRFARVTRGAEPPLRKSGSPRGGVGQARRPTHGRV